MEEEENFNLFQNLAILSTYLFILRVPIVICQRITQQGYDYTLIKYRIGRKLKPSAICLFHNLMKFDLHYLHCKLEGDGDYETYGCLILTTPIVKYLTVTMSFSFIQFPSLVQRRSVSSFFRISWKSTSPRPSRLPQKVSVDHGARRDRGGFLPNHRKVLKIGIFLRGHVVV